MVATGGGEDDLTAPPHRARQHDVGGGVAGVEADNHIHWEVRVVLEDIPLQKGQAMEAQVFRHSVAAGDDIRF